MKSSNLKKLQEEFNKPNEILSNTNTNYNSIKTIIPKICNNKISKNKSISMIKDENDLMFNEKGEYQKSNISKQMGISIYMDDEEEVKQFIEKESFLKNF